MRPSITGSTGMIERFGLGERAASTVGPSSGPWFVSRARDGACVATTTQEKERRLASGALAVVQQRV